MRCFFCGLALGLLGAMLWMVASDLAATASRAEGTDHPFADPVSGVLMVVGFAVMLLGPALFWVGVPLATRWRGRQPRASINGPVGE
jgi:hypothetical protein